MRSVKNNLYLTFMFFAVGVFLVGFTMYEDDARRSTLDQEARTSVDSLKYLDPQNAKFNVQVTVGGVTSSYVMASYQFEEQFYGFLKDKDMALGARDEFVVSNLIKSLLIQDGSGQSLGMYIFIGANGMLEGIKLEKSYGMSVAGYIGVTFANPDLGAAFAKVIMANGSPIDISSVLRDMPQTTERIR